MVLIGRCQDAARLRVALGADGIGNGHRSEVDDRDVVAGIRAELRRAGYAVKKVAHRKVVSHARSRIKNQSTPFSQATSAGFGWKPT